MKINSIAITIASFVIIILTLMLFLYNPISSNNKYKVVNGVLDVGNQELKKAGTINLDGEWEFFGNQIIYPEEFIKGKEMVSKNYATVPSAWNSNFCGTKKMNGDGFATYRMVVKLKKSDELIGLRIKDMSTAYKVFIDNDLVAENGKVGKTKELSIPKFYPQTVFYKTKNNVIQIVVQISNFHYARGGFWNSIIFGEAGNIEKLAEQKSSIYMFIFGSVIIIGIYHLLYFLLRSKELSLLYLGIFCILVATRFLVTEERMIYLIWGDMDWKLVTRLEYATAFLAPVLYYLFLYNIFQIRKLKVVFITIIFMGIGFTTLSMGLPIKIVTEMLYLLWIYIAVSSISMLVLILRAAYYKSNGYIIISFGFFFILVSCFYDIAIETTNKNSFYLLPFAVIIFILLQAYVLSMKFSKAFETVEQLSQERFNELNFDGVTGLMTRERFLIDVEGKQHPTVFFIKHDSLRSINDYFGYECIEGLLKHFANMLIELELQFKKEVYKTADDEFIILFDAEMSVVEKEILGKYIHEYLTEERYIYKENEIFTTIFIGIAEILPKETNKMKFGRKGIDILSNASIAMKTAKKNNSWFEIFDSNNNANEEYGELLLWAQKTRSAIEDDRILVYFQPIINNISGNVEKYESLIRMIEPDERIVPPIKFLHVSKIYHLYSYLTKAVIKKAFEYFAESEYEFSINISVEDILDKSTNGFILDMVKDYKNSKKVVFEILESEGIETYDTVIDFINEVRACGCKIAIDDFGSGYSNFERIFKLKIDYLKIDGSLIKNIDTDKNAEITVTTIIEFAKKIGIKTIAEYVHSKEVFEKVKAIGIDYSQGYHLGKPEKDTK